MWRGIGKGGFRRSAARRTKLRSEVSDCHTWIPSLGDFYLLTEMSGYRCQSSVLSTSR
jgi:hypothetical protein